MRATRLRVAEGRRYAMVPVYDSAEHAGLKMTEKDDWDILWSYSTPWKHEATLRRLPTVAAGKEPMPDPVTFALNHLPATVSLASKAHLIKFANSQREISPLRFGIGSIPESYLLPEQAAGFEQLARLRGMTDSAGFPRWLIKSKLHRGIHALWNVSRSTLAAAGSAIVQERVRPLLLRGYPRAFDLGLYVLVSSLRPLRVWAFDLSLVRFCERAYPQV